MIDFYASMAWFFNLLHNFTRFLSRHPIGLIIIYGSCFAIWEWVGLAYGVGITFIIAIISITFDNISEKFLIKMEDAQKHLKD
jgi:hypothetical protein